MADRRQNDRRQGDRRGMEALRAEALQTVMTQVSDRNFGGIKDRVRVPSGFKSSRMLLLAVAVIAGGTAAFLATQRDQVITAPIAAETVTEVVTEPMARVLVASQPIAVGQRLLPTALEWVEWPEAAVRPEFITASLAPDAITDKTGATARFEFFPGEPIREQKLLAAGDGGFLSAVLKDGMRGVSVVVAAGSASGGFVAPNDHVDVVLTRPSSENGQKSETVLRNVRVLAINAQLGKASTDAAATTDPEVFTAAAIATLELDSIAAEVIMTAAAYGQLSLALRSMTDFAEATSADFSSANQAIRLSSPFWAK